MLQADNYTHKKQKTSTTEIIHPIKHYKGKGFFFSKIKTNLLAKGRASGIICCSPYPSISIRASSIIFDEPTLINDQNSKY
jgi:hypothetical protein